MLSDLQKDKVKFVRAMYGKDHYEAKESVKWGYGVIIGWYILGYPTLRDIDADYSDEKILDFYEQIWGEVV